MRAVMAGMMIAVLCGQVAGAADDPERAPAPVHKSIDLLELLEASAQRLKKRFIIDPRMRAQVVMVNVDPQRMTYQELLAVLSVHGFVATPEIEGTVKIVPEANARSLPMPFIGDRSGNIGDEEVVMRTLEAGPLQAALLVPILRPLLPQYAHLVAHAETNTLIVVGRHANVRMMESILRDLRARPTHEVKLQSSSQPKPQPKPEPKPQP